MKNYFKKFSIMFVMSLVVIGLGMIQNISVANAATIGQQLTQPEAGWKRYDDTDSKIIKSGTIKTYTGFNGTQYYNQSYTDNRGVSNGFSINFKFYGTKLRILSRHTYDSSSNLSVNIDGTSESYSDYNPTELGPVLSYQKTGLSLGIHTVSITCQNGWVYLDAIDIDDTGYLVDPNHLMQSISLNKSSMDLTVGNSQQLTATTTPAGAQVTWSSSDSSIATVDNTGKVTAVKEGQATITATTTDGSNLSATCAVNVANQTISTSGITLNKTTDSMVVAQTDDLVATVAPDNATNKNVTWSSSDPSIATVDSTGKITAIKAGIVNITATTTDGLTATCAVTVAASNDGNNGGTPTGTDGANNIVNIAHAKGDNTNNAGGEVSIVFNGLPDTTLNVVKTADVKSVYVGDTFTYTIVVTNTGTKVAKAVVINDSAPTHIQFMPSGITTTQGTVDSSSTSSNILVNVGDIPPSGTVTIKIPANVIL